MAEFKIKLYGYFRDRTACEKAKAVYFNAAPIWMQRTYMHPEWELCGKLKIRGPGVSYTAINSSYAFRGSENYLNKRIPLVEAFDAVALEVQKTNDRKARRMLRNEIMSMVDHIVESGTINRMRYLVAVLEHV